MRYSVIFIEKFLHGFFHFFFRKVEEGGMESAAAPDGSGVQLDDAELSRLMDLSRAQKYHQSLISIPTGSGASAEHLACKYLSILRNFIYFQYQLQFLEIRSYE